MSLRNLFTGLQVLYLWQNDIEIITSGSLSFTATENWIGLGDTIKLLNQEHLLVTTYNCVHKLF